MPDTGLQLAQKVPLFFGLKPGETRRFLEICKTDNFPVGEVICEYGTASRRFFILLEGSLSVIGRDGTALADVRPVTTVGEMGFVNHKPRSATVITSEPSRLLRVEHHDFESLLDRDVDLRIKVYRNFVRVLADRLNDANDMLTRYKKLYESGGVPQPEAGVGQPAGVAFEPAPAEVDGEAVSDRAAALAAAEHEIALIKLFYELVGETPPDGHLEKDRIPCAALRQEGYTAADIEFAVKWTARNIPSAKRFDMVKLSIGEAFENRWSV